MSREPCPWCHDQGLCMHYEVTEEELRRMGEPVPGAVVKLEQTPDDDPFYTQAADA